jgi:hypothetical protein
MGLSALYERSSGTLDATNLHIDSPQMVLVMYEWFDKPTLWTNQLEPLMQEWG